MYFYCLNKTNSRTTFGNYDYFQFVLDSAFLPTEIPECPNHQLFSKNRDIDLKTAVTSLRRSYDNAHDIMCPRHRSAVLSRDLSWGSAGLTTALTWKYFSTVP